MLEFGRVNQAVLQTEPYKWAFVNELFSPTNAADLAATFPCDKVKKVAGYDREKGYEYFARSLVHMGASEPSHADGLSQHWRELANDFISPAYREAMSRLTGIDLSDAPLEANITYYGPDCWLGPHVDLKEKIVTHVLYFNQTWDRADGGYLMILGSPQESDVLAETLPLVGNSAVLVRSSNSWHAVARVAKNCQLSRRSLNVIFHLPGSVSTMWPPGHKPELSDYGTDASDSRSKAHAKGKRSLLGSLLGGLRR